MRHKFLLIAAAAILVVLLFFQAAFQSAIQGITRSSNSKPQCCAYGEDQKMLDWLSGIFGSRTSAYCRHEFPQACAGCACVEHHI